MNALKRRQILRCARSPTQLQRFKCLCGKGRKAKQEKAKKQGKEVEEKQGGEELEDSQLLPLHLPNFDLDCSLVLTSTCYVIFI